MKEYINKIIRSSKFKVYVLWFALKHPLTPRYLKFFGFLIIIYALSPIDLIPDFIPVLGLLDEVILLTVVVSLCLVLIPQDILQDAFFKAKELINSGGRLPKMKYGLYLILLIWIGVIGYVFTMTNVLSWAYK